MRKKVFSALLFGTLVVVSTGSLVSCKDYDDDITNLQEKVDASGVNVTSEISRLEGSSIIASRQARRLIRNLMRLSRLPQTMQRDMPISRLQRLRRLLSRLHRLLLKRLLLTLKMVT